MKDVHGMTDAELDDWCAELSRSENDLNRAWPTLDKLGYGSSAERVSGYAENVGAAYNKADEERERRRAAAKAQP